MYPGRFIWVVIVSKVNDIVARKSNFSSYSLAAASRGQIEKWSGFKFFLIKLLTKSIPGVTLSTTIYSGKYNKI